MTDALRLCATIALLAAALPASAKTSRPAPSPPLPGPAEEFHFAGTEPFWDGTIHGARMVWKTPDNLRGERIRVHRAVAPKRLAFGGRMAVGGAFTMIVVAKPCGDGMSDTAYPYDVTIDFGAGSKLLGCGWTARYRYKESP